MLFKYDFFPKNIEEFIEYIEEFKKNWKCYGEQVVFHLMNAASCPNLLKAVKSANKVLKKSVNSQSKTVTKQLVWFGKEQHSKIVRGKVRASINVQPTAVSRSKARGTTRRGRKVNTKGRPHKSKEAFLNMSDESQVPSQQKLKPKRKRAKHCFADALAKNKPPPRRHDKQ